MDRAEAGQRRGDGRAEKLMRNKWLQVVRGGRSQRDEEPP